MTDRTVWVTIAALSGIGGPALAGALLLTADSIVSWIVASALLISSAVLLAHVVTFVHVFARVRGAWETWLSR